MEVERHNPIPDLLAELDQFLDLGNYSGPPDHGENYYNKAWSVIQKDMNRNGLPSAERALHLCLVSGIPESKKVKNQNRTTPTRQVNNKPYKQSPYGKSYF